MVIAILLNTPGSAFATIVSVMMSGSFCLSLSHIACGFVSEDDLHIHVELFILHFLLKICKKTFKDFFACVNTYEIYYIIQIARALKDCEACINYLIFKCI